MLQVRPTGRRSQAMPRDPENEVLVYRLRSGVGISASSSSCMDCTSLL